MAPTFLSNIKQSHESAMSAWGDVIDNSRDARASRLDINVERTTTGVRTVVLTDDGDGMSETDMAKGIRGIGYTEKGLETGQHYGFGSTTSLPRLSDHCLVLSVRGGERTTCLLSTKLQTQLDTAETVTPHCTWTGTGTLLETTTEFLCPAARRKSLDTLIAFSPFSEADLLAQFTALGMRGTRVILWGSVEHEHQVLADDLQLRGEYEWAHERSLRSFLELLYYCDNRTTPSMQVVLRGTRVVPRNWSAYLHHASEGKPYRPQQVDAGSNGGEKPLAEVTFGYAVPMGELVSVCQKQSTAPDVLQRKKELTNYRGVFYYHRGRLILKLLQLQCATRDTARMATTHLRIRTQGAGLLGVCRESFLTVAHNKTSYKLPAAGESSRSSGGQTRDHRDLLFKKVSEHADVYLNTHAAPILDRALGKTAPTNSRGQVASQHKERQRKGKAVEQPADSSDDDDDEVIEYEDEEAAAAAMVPERGGRSSRPAAAASSSSSAAPCSTIWRRQQRQLREGGGESGGEGREEEEEEDRGSSSRLQEKRAAEASARRQAEAAAAADIIEDAWMVSKGGRKGRVVRAGSAAGRQLFQLRDQSGSLGSKRYGALDLQREALDLMQEQRLAAPVASLALSAARIWWRDTDDDSAGSFWSGVLHPSRQTPGVAGTFLLRYDGDNLEEFEDAGEEELVIFVQPNGEYLAHRADDGEQILRDEIELDEGAIARVVAAVFSAPSDAGASPDAMLLPAEERASAAAATAESTQMATAGASLAAAPTAEAVMPEAAASQPAPQAVDRAVAAGSDLIQLSSAGLAALDQAALEQRVSLLREALHDALCEGRVRSRGEDEAAEELLSSLPSAEELLAMDVEEGDDDENDDDEDDEADGDGDDADQSDGINGPTPESWRWYVLRALLDGRESMERETVVAYVLDNCTVYATKNPRGAVTTVLTREKCQAQPLWVSDGGSCYSLTAEGESLRGSGGFEDLEDDADDEAPPPPAPTIGSLRADCFAAICAGCTSRLAAVEWAWEHGSASTRGNDNRALHRADVVTYLGKEKAKERPLWIYSPDGDLSLTSDGRQLSGGAPMGSRSAASDASAQAAPTAGLATAATAAAAYLSRSFVASSHNGASSSSSGGGDGCGALGGSSSGTDLPAAELPAAEPPVPMTDPLPEGASPLTIGYKGRVSVEWPHHKLRYPGTVTAWKIALSRKNTPEHTYCVSYDDSQRCEHVLDDTRRRAWQLRAVNEELEDGWRQLDLMCVISKRRLETPARGEQCRHPALCNEAELRAYVGREKQCPIATCRARLERTAAIVCDTELQAQLADLPPSAERFWYGPTGEVSAACPSDVQPKRNKRVKVEI